jgi:hypothetical protein
MPVTIDGSNTPTAGGVVYGDGTNYVSTSAGTAGQVLLSNGASAPSFGAIPSVNLATGVTGTLPVGNGGTGATSLTANNVLLGNGTSAVQTVAPGTNGNVLTSNGTTWTSAAASSGALTLISTTTLGSPAKTFAVTSGFSSTYDDYLVIVENLLMDDNIVFGDTTSFRLYLNNVLQTTNYNATGYRTVTTNNPVAQFNSASSQIDLTNTSDDDTAFMSAVIYITNANTSTRNQTLITWSQLDTVFTSPFMSGVRCVNCSNAGSVTGIQLFKASNNFQSGTIRLYGVQK